jgi:hypothetical protein
MQMGSTSNVPIRGVNSQVHFLAALPPMTESGKRKKRLRSLGAGLDVVAKVRKKSVGIYEMFLVPDNLSTYRWMLDPIPLL